MAAPCHPHKRHTTHNKRVILPPHALGGGGASFLRLPLLAKAYITVISAQPTRARAPPKGPNMPLQ